MSNALKACPFCGGEEVRKHFLGKSITIQCRCCGAEVMGSTLNSNTTCQMSRVELDVEDKWNQRHEQHTETIAKQAERIEELKNGLVKACQWLSIDHHFNGSPLNDEFDKLLAKEGE